MQTPHFQSLADIATKIATWWRRTKKRNGRIVEVDINSTTTPKSIARLCSSHSQNLKQRGKIQWEAKWKAKKKGKDFHLLASSPAKQFFMSTVVFARDTAL